MCLKAHRVGYFLSGTGSHGCCYFCADSPLITQHILKQDIMIDYVAKTEKSTKYPREYEKKKKKFKMYYGKRNITDKNLLIKLFL